MPNGKAIGVAFADPRLDSVTLTGVLVADLPTAATDIAGMRMTVTDANATFTAGIGAAVVGGSTNVVPVFCDGAAWRIG